MISAITIFLLFASASAACTPAVMIPNGCALQGPADVAVEYALHDSTVDFAVKAPGSGFVALSIVKTESQIPGDAVFGFSNGTLQKWQINGPTFKEWLPSGVPLTNATVSGNLSLFFTRRFDSGRFRIDPINLSFDVYYGDDFNSLKATGSRVVANLATGEPAATTKTPPQMSVPVQVPSPVSAAESFVLNTVLIALLSLFPFIVAMS